MSTLYKRATPSQVRVLRIIEGAVRNASHAHPDKQISDEMVRSIAKRAAGTLTAGWPDVLAARTLSRRSPRTSGEISYRRPQGAQTTKRFGRGASHLIRRSPLQKIWKALSYEIGMAKRAGNSDRMCALVYVIRVIAAIEKNDAHARPESEERPTENSGDHPGQPAETKNGDR